jgi:uncharacterized sulfatase
MSYLETMTRPPEFAFTKAPASHKSKAKPLMVFLVIVAILAAGLPTWMAAVFHSPNVLFIVADDLGLSLGCYGHPLVKSPALDRLAAEGAKFERAYCQFPFCNPSRASFLSGKRPQTTGVLDGTTHPRKKLAGQTFLPEHFKNNGYFIARVGKIEHDTFTDVVKWDVAEDAPPIEDRPENDLPNNMPAWQASDLSDEELPDGRTTRRAIELIREHSSSPFFLAIGFHRPHRPLVAPKKYFDLYNTDDIVLPADAMVEDGVTPQQKREALRAYFACVSFMDAQVGLILNELDRLGLRENTIISFTGDHGVDLGQRDRFVRKQSLFENVIRVPLIFSGPRVPHALALNQFAELVDLYPTLAALARLPEAKGMEGLNLVPVLNDPAIKWRTAVFAENESRDRYHHCIRTERYKYTKWKNGHEALYDLTLDPDEKNNLAELPEYRKTIKQLKKMLKSGYKSALPPSP